MKKLFSSALSVLTSAALISGSAILYANAENTSAVNADLSQEVLYLDDFSDFSLSLNQNVSILSNNSDSAYNYRNFLDKNNAAVYDALAALVTPTAKPISVTLPQKVSVTVSSMPGTSGYTEKDQAAYQGAIFENCQPAINSVTFDMPEICWLDMSYFGISVGTDTVVTRGSLTGKYTITIKTLKFTPTILPKLGTAEKAAEYVEMLRTAVDEFPVSGESRYEQLKSIHDYITEFTYYDSEGDFAPSAIGALIEPGVVCEGYSKSFKLICDRLDIPCVLVFGNYNEAAQSAHMWNYVQMEDGKWYAVDVTWDDLDNEKIRKYEYFLKGSKSFSLKHTPEEYYNITKLNYPELSAEDYDPSAPHTTTVTTTVTTTTTTTTTATAPVKYKKGDVNRDGKVNIADLVYCQSTVIGRLDSEYLCDVDGNGYENSFDIALLRQILLKK